jgi:hypothetical protein
MYAKIPYYAILNRSYDEFGDVKSLLFYTHKKEAVWVPMNVNPVYGNNLLIVNRRVWNKLVRMQKRKKGGRCVANGEVCEQRREKVV